MISEQSQEAPLYVWWLDFYIEYLSMLHIPTEYWMNNPFFSVWDTYIGFHKNQTKVY